MNKLLPILLVVLLSGCATGIVASNENSVIVGNTFPWKQQEAFDIAEDAERPEFCDDIQVYAYTASEVEVAEWKEY